MHWDPPTTVVHSSSFVNPYLPQPAGPPDLFSVLPPPAYPPAITAASAATASHESHLVPAPAELQVGPTLVQDAVVSRPTTASSMMDDDEVNALLGWTDNLPE